MLFPSLNCPRSLQTRARSSLGLFKWMLYLPAQNKQLLGGGLGKSAPSAVRYVAESQGKQQS